MICFFLLKYCPAFAAVSPNFSRNFRIPPCPRFSPPLTAPSIFPTLLPFSSGISSIRLSGFTITVDTTPAAPASAKGETVPCMPSSLFIGAGSPLSPRPSPDSSCPSSPSFPQKAVAFVSSSCKPLASNSFREKLFFCCVDVCMAILFPAAILPPLSSFAIFVSCMHFVISCSWVW